MTFPRISRFLKINLVVTLILISGGMVIGFFPTTGIKQFLGHFVLFYLITTAMSTGGFMVDCFFEKRISWKDQPMRRFIVTLVTYLGYAFGMSFLILTVFVYIWISPVTLEWRILAFNAAVSSGIAMLVYGFFVSRWWLKEWQRSAIQIEKLETEKMKHQYKALVDQLNPHFLFNSLNTLASLVHDDPELSDRFIQKLSRIYRYVLDAQNRELVSLKEELAFARDYLALQKIRFDERLVYDIRVEKEDLFFLPPLSLQMLIENALKHNKALINAPLILTIVREGHFLKVSNTYNPMPGDSRNYAERGEGGTHSPSVSTSVGLENIRNRYAMLGSAEMTIEITDQKFNVTLPLFDSSSGVVRQTDRS